MQQANSGGTELTPEEGWRAIHATIDRAHSSMYLAGTASILLLWGVITSLWFFAQFAVIELAPDFAAANPWYGGPVWGVLGTAGMAGSAVIGHRAGRRNMAGDAARNARIRVFLFWLAVVAAAFLIPGVAGMWTAGDAGDNIARVAMGVVTLGFILFGIMHRPAIAAIGAGIAAAFYIPGYLAGDAAAVVSGVATLAVAVLGVMWIRKSGLP